MFESIVRFKKLNTDRLPDAGFSETENGWKKTLSIMNEEFDLTVTIFRDGSIDTDLKEASSGEEYWLYKTGALGSYVGAVRTAVEEALTQIAERCYDPAIFKQEQTLRLIGMAKELFGDDPEYLWEKFPDNAVLRRKDNEKWYAAILTTSRDRFGLDSRSSVEVVDLRAEPERVEALLRQDGYYPAWHMNKKHWFTVLLDDSLPDERLKELLSESRRIAGPKERKKL